MNELEEYYEKKLYPMQDGILQIIKELELPFYLTGGTAISRYYSSIRYSDDLDLFVNNDNNFYTYVKKFYEKLQEREINEEYKIDKSKVIVGETNAQFFIQKSDTLLKIDFVNDIAPHFGNFIIDDVLGKIDSFENILSNKITALFRYEPKDVVDIWILCKKFSFDFKEIINEAQSKDLAVDPLSIYEILYTFPIEKLELIKWIKKPDYEILSNDIKIIAEDIFYGRQNSLIK